jgi:starch-binding outer membrane protein, SusD/RagB family
MIMRKIWAYITIILLFSNCKKSFLQVVPQGEQVAQTVADYDMLMNAPNFYREQYAGGWQEPEAMGDELSAIQAYIGTVPVPYNLRLFQWSNEAFLQADPPPFFIVNETGYIYIFNKVINEVDGASEGNAQQKAALKAEAKANRAFANFSLINYYAKPYSAATASTDPGFPIVKEAKVTAAGIPRGTVQEMYDFIIQDLQDAIKDLPQAQTYKTRFSRPAAEGLLGKVYLFMGRPADALPYLDAAFADLTNTSLYDYNQTFAPGGAFTPIDPNYGPPSNFNSVTDFTEDVVTRIFPNTTYTGNQLCNTGLVMSAATRALFDDRDLRLMLYTPNATNGQPNPGGLLRKFGDTYSRWGIQLSELYLLRAECKARQNDLPGAKADVEALRAKRMPADIVAVPTAIATDQTALIKFIIDERTREFAFDGYRWFDMRRLSVDPLFTGLTFTHILYNTDNTTTTFTLNQPNRLVLRFPYSFLTKNPGMQDNP